jgi:catechol 2,3-dioxygenase-like lactoylglutathione lyase family enzyme
MPDIPTSNPQQFVQGAPLLTVPDVSRTASYYQQVLGFHADTSAVTPQYGVVWRDNAAVHFAAGERISAGVRVFFWVKDVNQLYEELRARGAQVAEPIGTRTYHMRDFSIRDPNGIELVFGQDWD